MCARLYIISKIFSELQIFEDFEEILLLSVILVLSGDKG